MIVIDTSIWIDHFARADHRLEIALTDGDVAMHPMVFAEIMLGSPPNRAWVGEVLSRLPSMLPASTARTMAFVERHALHGTGLGFVDACILATLDGRAEAVLWTRDRRMNQQARRIGIGTLIPT